MTLNNDGEVQAPSQASSVTVNAPLAGNIFKIQVSVDQQVAENEVLLILEAMKMETEVRAPSAMTIAAVAVNEGDAVAVGDLLIQG